MTPIELLEQLKEFIKENTKDLVLPTRTKGNEGQQERPAGVYKMRLPTAEGETKLIPYILLQLISGDDTQEAGQESESGAVVRIVVATYSEDGEVGAMNVLNVITRIRIALLKAGEVGGQFLLVKPIEYIIYPDSTYPYFLGEMITRWELPAVEREVENTCY